MAVSFKYLPYTYDDTPIDKLCGESNNPHIPGGIIDKLVDEFTEVNGEVITAGDNVFIPILPPFCKKHEGLLERNELDAAPEEEEEPELVIEEKEEPIPEPIAEVIAPVEVETRTFEPPVEIQREPVAETRPKKTKTAINTPKEHRSDAGNIQYKLFPYTFSRPGETIEAVIRLYNDMSTGPATLKKLTYEFTRANLDALPPKLGQTVQVPVLLPFVYRHVNKNKIFKET